MVGILLSYWGGLFSGAFAVSFREGRPPLEMERNLNIQSDGSVLSPGSLGFSWRTITFDEMFGETTIMAT